MAMTSSMGQGGAKKATRGGRPQVRRYTDRPGGASIRASLNRHAGETFMPAKAGISLPSSRREEEEGRFQLSLE
jgi:hypothetical protein